MSLDRFVRWEDKAPSREELTLVLEDFVGESGVVRWDDGAHRFFIVFAAVGPGHQLARVSSPERRAGDVTAASRACAHERYHEDIRSIEVFLHDDCLDVITRLADAFTNGVAARLAEEFARLFRGVVEAG